MIGPNKKINRLLSYVYLKSFNTFVDWDFCRLFQSKVSLLISIITSKDQEMNHSNNVYIAFNLRAYSTK
ncbi:hypothetical protein BpHYR1_020807 [Brachionus plicatilis]|uniref:Uncharacterized protein n=1 Tax=Brachionus plicatilis TaxID=10195 RepID=A0A3M7PVY4_BRAPC|nr:hypothetical protein BpHYR1_020807 [Brachionus plicatilis]